MDSSIQNRADLQHIYVIGAKSIGLYGGFETFVMELLKKHGSIPSLKYHVSCKRNGSGCMDFSHLQSITKINEDEFLYNGAHCFLIDVNEALGSGQALDYDLKSLRWCCEHIEKNHIKHPIVYILASRIGPFEGGYVKKIHAAGGLLVHNPDGHEDWRRKWSLPIRKYWKYSESHAVRNADLVICDSKNIEKYIKKEYKRFEPNTTWIPYGSVVPDSVMPDDDPRYVNWLANHDLKDGKYYISVGRLVPENNFEYMIKGFMDSHTDKDFAIISTNDGRYMDALQQKLNYTADRRIKFVGSVYDHELLTKIRCNAYGYLHGHSVGGTNPSLLEALGTTKINLLYDVVFNREVAEDGAIYWGPGSSALTKVIDSADKMSMSEIMVLAEKARQRIRDVYSWDRVAEAYLNTFLRSHNTDKG